MRCVLICIIFFRFQQTDQAKATVKQRDCSMQTILNSKTSKKQSLISDQVNRTFQQLLHSNQTV